MKKKLILIGLLVLSVLVVSCAREGAVAGEGVRGAAAPRCPSGCDIVSKLNSAFVRDVPFTSIEGGQSCDDVCTPGSEVCIGAEAGIGSILPGGDGTIYNDWEMVRCNHRLPNKLRCRCYIR